MFHPALPLPKAQSRSAVQRASHPLPVRILATLILWARRHRGRAELRGLDDRTLHDIGISREQAAYEGSKPFWRA